MINDVLKSGEKFTAGGVEYECESIELDGDNIIIKAHETREEKNND